MAIKFTGHLHVHTEYSPLDGMARIEELILRAKEMGQTGIAITDHGSSSGLFQAYELGEKHGFNVLLGEEFYFQNKCEDLKTGHLILIAKNERGLANIFALQRKAYNNFYYKPRINMKMLEEHAEGLICTTACIANQIGQFILRGEEHLALNHILELRQIFRNDLFVELQSATNEDVIKVNKKLESFCQGYGLQPIITSDVHYTLKEDYKVHEVLLCIQQKAKMDSPKRWKFENNDYWLKSQEELLSFMDYLHQDTIENSMDNIENIFRLAAGVKIKKGNYLPKYCDEDENNILKEQVFLCYDKRIRKRGEDNEAFLADVQKELKVIQETGYSGYFMIVNEYIQWAKANGILVGDGRGSGAGSKVAYTLGITEVNPQKHDLLFERFLTPGREPDFDVDFSDIDAVFRHLQDRYGEENVARVGAFSRFTAKSAIRKVMGVYGFSMSEIAKVVAMLPKRLSFTLREALDESREFARWMNANKNILYVVEKFEGVMEHLSTHAGGVIICEGLANMLPIVTDSEDRDKMVVALDKKLLESLGHYKFDILGLSSLTLMQDIIDYTGEIDWTKVDFEDGNIYEMLSSGDVLGVFQLSEQPDKVRQQSPRCFEDLIAINALIRPGVCDWNEYLKRRFGKPEKDEMAELSFMKGTHGLIVYQDQYLQLAQHYAGWDIAFSDKQIRKNKDIYNDAELKEKWMWDSGGMEDLWNVICEVVDGGYGFNRAHATSYAKLAFQTAYMKRYHPKEFYSAYLTQNLGDSAKTVEILNKLKESGIKVLNPDINKSKDKFTPTKEGILFPLNAVKGVGGSALHEINRLRPIQSFEDFMARRVPRFVRSTTIENLIKAGAFDFEEEDRHKMLLKYKPDFERKENHVYEKEAFDYYVTSSPFDRYSCKPFREYGNNESAITVVEVIKLNVRHDKNGNEMAFVTGTNNTDIINLILFSTVWKRNKMEEGQLVLVKGRKDGKSLLVNSFEVLNGN